MRTLRQHGLPDDAPHKVFQAVVINKLTHASPAWWGFASADDRNRLRHSYESVQNWVTELSVRQLSAVSVMMPIANCSLVLPATLNTCCIRSSPLNASITTLSLFINATFNYLIVHLFLETQNFIMRMLYSVLGTS